MRRNRPYARLQLEPLEARVLPAVLLNPTTLSYTDVDGDAVRVTVSKGTFALSNSNGGNAGDTFTLVNQGLGQQLQLIDLTNGKFAGANLSVTATRTASGGDGFANVGFINSTGFDLGMVSIHGDLGRIDAGDLNLATTSPGIVALNVHSMGRFGTSTQVGGGNLFSSISGNLNSFSDAGDVDSAELFANGAIASVYVGGSILGGASSSTGRIEAIGNIGSVKVMHDVVASDQDETGKIVSFGSIGSIYIGGSLVGGTDPVADTIGQIHASGNLGPVTILGDVRGNSADRSAQIDAGGKIASIVIHGSLLGGAGTNSARILSGSDIGPVAILGDIRGGGATDSGKIDSGGKLGNVTVLGSVLGGAGTNSGQIHSAGNMGLVTVGHDVVAGGANETGKIFTAGSLAGVTIGGSLVGTFADEETPDPAHAGQIFGASIGPVHIGGNMEGSTGGSSGRISSSGNIASLFVGGSVLGSSGDASAQVGTSGSIGPVHINGDLSGGNGNSAGAIYGNTSLSTVFVGGSIIGGSGDNSGTVSTGGNIGLVTIGHDLRGGSAAFNLAGAVTGAHIAGITVGGSLIASTMAGIDQGMILASHNIGPILVRGSLIGNSTNPVVITAIGQATPVAPIDIAIASLTVLGRVEFSNILAGYYDTTAINADAQIGAVTVVGDWIASNLVAGVQSASNLFGTGGDTAIAGGKATIISKIASIVIGGAVEGTVGAGDHYGFVAQYIGLLEVGGITYGLKAGPRNDLTGFALGATGDVVVHEVL